MNPRRTTTPATDSWFAELDALDAASRRPAQPEDQAAGLRQLFTSHTLRFVPVVSNPHLAFGGVVLERLCSAYAEMGLRTLVVDAGEQARAPSELTAFDLAEGVEPLAPQIHYLAARGLALRFVDASGSTAGFLDAVADAAPDTDVVLVHASAAELARLLTQRVKSLPETPRVRPVVLTDDHADAMTHAYAAIKLLAVRAGLRVHDLLVCAPVGSKRAALVAERLARCADDFVAAVQRDWVAVDPATDPKDLTEPALGRLAREQLAAALPVAVTDSAFGALHQSFGRSALPALRSRRGTGGAAC